MNGAHALQVGPALGQLGSAPLAVPAIAGAQSLAKIIAALMLQFYPEVPSDFTSTMPG